MRFRTATLLFAAAIGLVGCAAKISVEKTLGAGATLPVKPSPPDREKADYVFYALPKTVIETKLTIQRTLKTPGKYAVYTPTLFPEIDSDDYVTSKRIALKFSDPGFSSFPVPDMAEIYRRAYGDAHDFVAVAESNVASVLMRRGDWAAAERRLAAVVDHFRRSVGDEHLNTAIARVKHGRTLLRLGRFDDAALESAAGRDALLRLEEGESSWARAAESDLTAASERRSAP